MTMLTMLQNEDGEVEDQAEQVLACVITEEQKTIPEALALTFGM